MAPGPQMPSTCKGRSLWVAGRPSSASHEPLDRALGALCVRLRNTRTLGTCASAVPAVC
jgi:hypothetical protein